MTARCAPIIFPSKLRLSLDHLELVPDAPHGLQVRITTRTPIAAPPLELFSQASNVHVDGARVSLIIKSPHPLEQLFPFEGAARVACEVPKEVEFFARQPHRLSMDEAEPASAIDLQLWKCQPLASFGPFIGSSPQNGLNPEDELLGAEGLRDIVIGPQLETEDAVNFFPSSGQHNDGNFRLGTDPA